MIDLLIIKKEKARLRLEKSKALRQYPQSELITIIDADNMEFKEGMKFRVVKESDNRRAADAFGVYMNDRKIGIAANRFTSKCGSTSTVCDIKGIPNEFYVEYVTEYDNYHIARIITVP